MHADHHRYPRHPSLGGVERAAEHACTNEQRHELGDHHEPIPATEHPPLLPTAVPGPNTGTEDRKNHRNERGCGRHPKRQRPSR